MKRNHVRWLTAVITTALLLLGTGLPAKAQLPVVGPPIITSDFINLGKEIAQAKKQCDEFVRVYDQVADFISICKDVKAVYKAVEDLSRILDEALRSQRNNKYLYDFEKIKCRDQTYALLKERMSIVKEMKKFAYLDTDPSNKGRLKLSDGDRLSLTKELKDEVVTLRNKAYQIVGYYNKLSQSRSEKATTRRLFGQLNDYK